jgi:hypothetical protein
MMPATMRPEGEIFRIYKVRCKRVLKISHPYIKLVAHIL